jgi:DNA-binding NarL/FixJ family response regulator
MLKYRILIADDHEIVRHGLRALLEGHAGWEVCAEAVDGWDAVNKTAELKPDVVAMDVGMPNLNGLDAARQILRDNPRQKILFLTMYHSEQLARTCMQAGVRGLLLKSEAGLELVSAIEALQRNGTFFSSRFNSRTGTGQRGEQRGKTKETLTPRERQVVQLLAEGKTTKEVASALNLSVKTAETHRSNIMGKLDLHSISEVVLYAVRNNIVQAFNSENSPFSELDFAGEGVSVPVAPGTAATD